MVTWQSLSIFAFIKKRFGNVFLLSFTSKKLDPETKGGIHLAAAASELLFLSNPVLCVLSVVSENSRIPTE